MNYVLRNATAADLPAVLVLNQKEVPHVGSVDLDQMAWHLEHADYFVVAMLGDSLQGFLIGYLPADAYQSPNYRWFCDRYDNFGYIDRIALDGAARGTGLASTLYRDFRSTCAAHSGRLTCEVNLKPENPASLKFHEKLGFVQVGTLADEDGSKVVAMLELPF